MRVNPRLPGEGPAGQTTLHLPAGGKGAPQEAKRVQMSQIRTVVSSQANPRAGLWVADGIFRALAQSQAGSWIKAAPQALGRAVWWAERVSRQRRLWERQQARGLSCTPGWCRGFAGRGAPSSEPCRLRWVERVEREIILLMRTEIRQAAASAILMGRRGQGGTCPIPSPAQPPTWLHSRARPSPRAGEPRPGPAKSSVWEELPGFMRVREASVCQASRVRRVWEGAAESQAHGRPRPSQPAAFTEPTPPGQCPAKGCPSPYGPPRPRTDAPNQERPRPSLLTRGKEASPLQLWDGPGSRGLAALLVLSGLGGAPVS